MRSWKEIKDSINSNEKLGGESELDRQLEPGDIRDIYNPSGKNHPSLRDEIAKEKTDARSFVITIAAAIAMLAIVALMGSFVMRHAASEAAGEAAKTQIVTQEVTD